MTFKCLPFLLFLLVSDATAAEIVELCLTDEVKEIKHRECNVTTAPFRDRNQLTTIEIATLDTGVKVDFDEIIPTFAYVVRALDGRIVRVASVPYLSGPRFWDSGGPDRPPLGGRIEVYFESKFVEQFANSFCAVYKSKYPFVGEYVDCGGDKPLINTVNYVTGVTTAKEARDKICSIIDAEVSGACKGNDGGRVGSPNLLSGRDGHMRYVLKSQLRLQAMRKHVNSLPPPVECENREYEVSLSGEVQLRGSCLDKCGMTCNLTGK
jgi:hypothetical protein